MKRFLLATSFVALLPAASNPEYSIQAILLANSPGDSVADMVMGAPPIDATAGLISYWNR